MVAFQVQQLQMGGPPLVTQINAGDQGTVQVKHAQAHMLSVFWDRLKRVLPITHDQVHKLRRI
jgi:hypothetical protein